MFAAWGRFVYRFRWLVLLVSILSLGLAVFLMGQGGKFDTDYFPKTTESGRAFALMEQQLPGSPPQFSLIFSSADLKASDPAFQAAVEQALSPLRSDQRVARIRTAYDSAPPNPQYFSKDGQRSFAVVELKGNSSNDSAARDAYPELRAKVTSDRLEVVSEGILPLNHDFTEVAKSDLERAELVSLPLALVLLVLVFGSLLAAGLPLGVGVLSIVGGLAGTLLLARFTPVSTYASNIVTMIGLGVAIDYSLFVVSRFREEVRGRPVALALERTMATAGRAILFSGLTVAIGLLGMTFFQLSSLSSMGLAGTIVVALAVLYGLTFLPALLAILGPKVNLLKLPFLHPDRPASENGLWHRLSTVVMARPWFVLIPTVALLLLLGSPFLHIRLGSGDATALPKDSEARQGDELLRQQFPGGDTNRVITVVSYQDGTPLSAARVGTLYDFSRWLAQQPGVSRVDSIVNLDPSITKEQYQQIATAPQDGLPPGVQTALNQTVGKNIATLIAYTPARSGSDEARNLVKAIREQHPPVSGAEVLVTGETAFDLDFIALVTQNVPFAIGFIVLATYVVLFLLLGSVLLPLKAVVMNLFSLTASYGALVWLFQDGHLASWLNFTPGPIETSTPIIMFCILFGLSMDYEVLLLSRMREEVERTGDNTRAVASSLERTGKLITSAAAIMAGVFLAFGSADTVVIKAIGIGMGLAVVVDATIVRALLVPATMRLMGSWNWWAPAPLARLYRRLGLAESHGGAVGVTPVPVGAVASEKVEAAVS